MTTRERIAAGDLPGKFWINSLGEFGHKWPDGTESIGGTVNITEATRNYPAPRWSEEAAIKQQFEAQLSEEVVSPTELSLYRLWEHLQPLAGYFHFSGGVDAEGRPSLYMTIEYVLHTSRAPELQAAARELSPVIGLGLSAAWSEPMWADLDDASSGKWQYVVNIPVFGESFGKVVWLQAEWDRIATMHQFDEARVALL